MRTERILQAINRIVEPAVRAGLGNSHTGPGLFVIETTGHRSGLTRRVPLLAIRAGDRLVVATIRRRSHWVSNLAHQPHAGVWIAGRRHPTAAVARLDRAAVAHLSLDRCPPARRSHTEH